MLRPVRGIQGLLATVKLMFDGFNLWRDGGNQPYQVLALDRPSPSLVPVPFLASIVAADLIEKRLPNMEFGRFTEKQRVEGREEEATCAICLSGLEAGHEIRELPRCCHAFHSECLDPWLKRGQITCPLCRSKLWAHEQGQEGEDEWREERIAYLFGEDYAMVVW
ncbi:brassinosteroid-responsive RING protein 1-like [Diospyros lotus]|uniref:brassinosteroid-responsive RING protein 1-like n=1 Tax=Diospyros lotus TaxID=55363 RepID=UPI00225A3CB1|nr:brassinosteroid-responsive RING protein 1-like [Diospyros lotus]